MKIVYIMGVAMDVLTPDGDETTIEATKTVRAEAPESSGDAQELYITTKRACGNDGRAKYPGIKIYDIRVVYFNRL